MLSSSSLSCASVVASESVSVVESVGVRDRLTPTTMMDIGRCRMCSIIQWRMGNMGREQLEQVMGNNNNHQMGMVSNSNNNLGINNRVMELMVSNNLDSVFNNNQVMACLCNNQTAIQTCHPIQMANND